MTTLEERMEGNALLRMCVLDPSTPNRAIAREFDIDESVIRRWRNRNIVAPTTCRQDPPTATTTRWEPGLDLTGDRGEGVTLPAPVRDGVDPTELELLEQVGADPEKWEIVDRKESRWQNAAGEWLQSHKVTLGRRGAQAGDLSVEQLNEILDGYVGNGYQNYHYNGVFVVPIADLQAGKIDGGGTAALVDRFGRIVQEVRGRLEREGGCELLIIPVLGDCIEGMVHQGGKFALQLDISVTEQVRVYRRLLMHMIAELAGLAKRLVVPVLPGNHDEQTRVLDTGVADSWAIEGASAVADALEMNPRFQHVEFIFPGKEELVITLNVGTQEKPFVLGFTHGHLAKAPNSVEAWWGKQAFGKQQVGDANMLFSGHFHHLRIEQMGTDRVWIQAPALDGGSEWFRRTGGSTAPAGMISIWITPGQGIGWEGLTVHTGE